MQETMLENGLDFILSAAQYLEQSEQTKDEKAKSNSLKYSLLHLSSGIELIMKARLYIEHWTYIFADMNKANQFDLNSGEMKTLDYSKCIERLGKLCNVTVSEADKTAFEDLRKIRNQVEHFKTGESIPVIDSCINRALSSTLKFLNDNYETFSTSFEVTASDFDIRELTDIEKKYIDDITLVVGRLSTHHKEVVDLAVKRVHKLCSENEVVKCPSCKEQTLLIADDDGNCRCFFCGYKGNGEETARNYLLQVVGLNEYEIVKDGGSLPLYSCPECEAQSLVRIGSKYVCFSCRMHYDHDQIKFCEECGEAYDVNEPDHDCGLCNKCLEYKKSKLEKD